MLPHHGRYDYSAIDERPDYSWPDGKRLAFYVCVAVEHFAFGAGVAEDISHLNAPETQRNFGWRDYGQRVGLWRLLEMLDRLQIPVALAVNGMIFRQQPLIAERIRKRHDEVIAHGRTSSESMSDMWSADELQAVRDVTDMITTGTGNVPAGWASPGFVESPTTLDILVESGYRYALDWPADDQPFWMKAKNGRILSIPFPLELNDITVLLHRHQSGRDFAGMIVNQFEEMIKQSEDRPLVLPLALHPYVVGQPFRLRALRKALTHCMDRRFEKRLWLTRPGEIARHCIALPPEIIP